MSLFQNTVTKKYLLSQGEIIKSAYKLFVSYFLNSDIQENIRNSKEEQFQEGFLRELFVKVLGYTLNPELDYNLITEHKNEKDSKKADGAILVRGEVVGVIELKDHKTIDLKQVEAQAFGYKNNHRKASYVVTSNFEKLRFYIDNAIDFVEFNLFSLTEEQFAILWLCLAYQNIVNDLPKQMKSESAGNEDQITKQLYKDYSEFKRELFADLKENNPQYNKLTLFKKSQKLLDRLLFILFAEDCGLLPPNSVGEIIKQWEALCEMDEYRPLYDRLKKYFGYMNTGHKGKKHDIFAYNGGLFKSDEVLDNVVISDEVLQKYASKISKYDFASEVDVNILGHIFENSLVEIEEITSELESGRSTASKVNKRKKDGIFYTPRYVTTYIVENTLGKLCYEKKTELEIDEAEYFTDRKRQTATKKRLNDKLKNYREWLLRLTICDPACGSGAFLNAALDYLMNEHHLIDEMFAKIHNVPMVLPDIENSILENNLYGVDINEESVEIAKLSLWLRTAKPNRKLNSLNNNIKCGNSLISDPAVAGDKAFDWHKEFPQVFEEKQKKTFHITTAIHDSRTSRRMIDYKIREKRHNGSLPDPQVYSFSDEEEIVISETIAQIVKKDGINVIAYNICADHFHLLLVCEAEEVSSIVGKIKSMTARACNIARGNNKGASPLVDRTVPVWTQKFGCKEVVSEEHLWTAVDYIHNNRKKHELSLNKTLQSLVKEIEVSYEHAFRTEYKGGFDVVIGNPPYVQANDEIYDNYITAKCGDLYAFFFEKGLYILKHDGMFSYITPSLFIKGMRYESLRDFLLTKSTIIEILDKGDGVFAEVQMPTAITTLRNTITNNQTWDNYLTNNYLIEKLSADSISIGETCKIMRGLEIGKDKVERDVSDIQFLCGEDIFRYGIYRYSYIDKGTNEKYKKDEYYFSGNRVLIRETGNRLTSIFLKDNITQNNRSLYSIKTHENKQLNPLFLLSVINSNLMQFIYQTKFAANTNIFPKIRIGQVKELPIKQIPLSAQQPFIEKADLMLSLNAELQTKRQRFIHRLQDNFENLKITGAIEKFDETDFKGFLSELKKQKIKLSLKQQDEWEAYFNEYKTECNKLSSQIAETDKAIDQMVYELYELTEEEIEIVEK